MIHRARSHWILTVVLLAGAFGFRLMYGLSSPFWSEDERQVYLIGLRSFARGEWPYFGADVVWTAGQVPGALQGMLIRWPLTLWPAPEAPFILLNLLSLAALAFFAWYLTRRLPDVPRWLVWIALFTLPWTLNFSTHIVNPSYVLPGAILFFIGFFEGMPVLRRRLVPFATAWALMGAGLFFVMQIHLSWVLLPPYVLAAGVGLAISRPESLGMTRAQAVLRAILGFVAGSAVTGSLLLPTLMRYGIAAAHPDNAIVFHPQGPFGIVTIAARVLSLASFETNRFLGLSTAERVLALWRHAWIIPFALAATAAGLLQPLWMALTMFRSVLRDAEDWTYVRILVLATIVLVYASYFLSVRGPQAHSFYVVFPVATLFACSCWQVCARVPGARVRRWERVTIAVLASGVVMHVGLAIDRFPRQSMYTDRSLVAAAIEQRNDRFLGDRRDAAREQQDHRPRPIDRVNDVDAYLAARPENDLQLVSSTWAPAIGRISTFSVTITNRSRVAAWLDIRYATAYLGAQGQPLAAREGVIKHILQPGATRTWSDIADDFVPAGATEAVLTIIGAEKVIPRR